MSVHCPLSTVHLLLGLALPAALQAQSDTRLYRLVQGGAEVGRESYRRSGAVIERSVTVPVLSLRADSRTEFDAAGRFRRFAAEVFNAAGDTSRGRFELVVDGDSLLETRVGRTTSRSRGLRLTIDGVIPPQSVSLVSEAIERAGGRDTTFRMLPMGADTAVPVTVRFRSGRAEVVTAGIVATRALEPDAPIEAAAQRLVATPWNGRDSLPPLAGLRRPRPDYSAPPGAPYTAEEVRVTIRPAQGDSFIIAGTLTLPVAGRAPFPVVVTMSGSGQQDRDEELWPLITGYRPFRQVAERLAREGIAVLRYDDRTVGGSGGAVGGTTADYADDVRQLVAWLRTRPDIDPARVALLGHSEGGVMGPLLAAGDPRLVAVVIWAGPSQTGRTIVRYQLERPIRTAPGLSDSSRARMLSEVDSQLAGWAAMNPWARWFADHDPLVVARRVRQPVLIQHGALDRQVTAAQADSLGAAIRAAGNRDVTVRVYQGLNHLFLPTDGDGSPTEYAGLRDVVVPAAVLDELANWLRERMSR